MLYYWYNSTGVIRMLNFEIMMLVIEVCWCRDLALGGGLGDLLELSQQWPLMSQSFTPPSHNATIVGNAAPSPCILQL